MWQYEISGSGSVPCGEESVDDVHCRDTDGNGPQDLLVQHMQPSLSNHTANVLEDRGWTWKAQACHGPESSPP